ncbi:MAG: tetratricopeptide repeat protein, partial [Woeseiaceae bacterium]|nr:tetratricopeptide repeat protein [Woeseiaceae bacterium]
LVIGLPVVAVFSWVYELTPDGLLKTEDVPTDQSITPRTGRRLDIFTAVGVVILIGLVLMDRYAGPAGVAGSHSAATMESPASGASLADADKSIAVLPFVAMTDSKDDEYFADGLSEELLNVLAKNKELKVAGRTSAFYYKGRNEDLRTIADALGVAHILEGSVRRSGDQIRVTAQLIKADDGFHVWSETYDRESGDIFRIQDEISASVAQALQAEILGTAAGPAAASSAEAENLYLVAQAALAARNLADVRRARDLYAQASILDPANPKYLAGYAHAVSLQYWNSRDISSEEAIREAGDAITKAINLGPPSADTLAVAGLVEEMKALALNDQAAKQKALDFYQTAVRQAPSNILALQWLASIYLDIREPGKAKEYFEKVVELDPLNTLSLAGLAQALIGLGRLDDARLHLFRMQSLFPDRSMVHRYLAGLEYQAGRLDRNIFWMRHAVEVDPNPIDISFLLYGYITLGWADEALETAERYNEARGSVDVSRLVQAQLDQDIDAIAEEARLLHSQLGEERFALLSAWADAVAGRCADAAETLDRQFPSLRGEVIEYIENNDLIDAILLIHCDKKIGKQADAKRLSAALWDTGMLSDSALQADKTLPIVRVAFYAVTGEVDKATSELAKIDRESMTLGITAITLPIDQLPVFEALYDTAEFQEYAQNERYRTAQLARQLAAGETDAEVVAMVEDAGYTMGR